MADDLTLRLVRGSTVPCAYCGKDADPLHQACDPWLWPDKGMVTNCVDCSGDERLAAVTPLAERLDVILRRRREPVPFSALEKRRSFAGHYTPDQIYAALVRLHDCGMARVVHGRGWQAITP